MMEGFLNNLLKLNNYLSDLLFSFLVSKQYHSGAFFSYKTLRRCIFNGSKTETYLLLLFPLDRTRWFGCDIVDYSVHAFDFIADSSAHFFKDFPGETEVVGGHAV